MNLSIWANFEADFIKIIIPYMHLPLQISNSSLFHVSYSPIWVEDPEFSDLTIAQIWIVW